VSENEGRSPEPASEGEQPAEPEPEQSPPPESTQTEPEPEPTPAAEPAAETAAAASAVAATPPPPSPATTSEWTPPPAAATSTPIPLSRLSDYPVVIDVPTDPGQNRLWGIPCVGLLVRSILVIPQFIVLWVLGIITGLLTIVSWAPILIAGRQASFVYTIAGGYLRLSTRVAGYVLLLTGRYPPFGPGGEHSIDVTFDESDRQNRLWGIPFVGLLVRWIILIPHFIVLMLIGIVVAFMILVSWVPVLFLGRQAEVIVQWIGGFYRWGVRVSAYALLLSGKYPPFRLDN
jgi:uncharacterized protein DUF4389